MDEKTARAAPDPSGKTPFRMSGRGGRASDLTETLPGTTHPPTLRVGTLDSIRAVFWEAYRHLFPPHSVSAQTRHGSLVISWSITDEPDARYPYAAPVVLRFEEDLLVAMAKADLRQRLRIAQNHEPTLREGMRGYDPFSRFPNARVVTIG